MRSRPNAAGRWPVEVDSEWESSALEPVSTGTRGQDPRADERRQKRPAPSHWSCLWDPSDRTPYASSTGDSAALRPSYVIPRHAQA